MTATFASNDIYNLNYSKGLRVGIFNVMPPVIRSVEDSGVPQLTHLLSSGFLILTYGDAVGAFDFSKAPFFMKFLNRF